MSDPWNRHRPNLQLIQLKIFYFSYIMRLGSPLFCRLPGSPTAGSRQVLHPMSYQRTQLPIRFHRILSIPPLFTVFSSLSMLWSHTHLILVTFLLTKRPRVRFLRERVVRAITGIPLTGNLWSSTSARLRTAAGRKTLPKRPIPLLAPFLWRIFRVVMKTNLSSPLVVYSSVSSLEHRNCRTRRVHILSHVTKVPSSPRRPHQMQHFDR